MGGSLSNLQLQHKQDLVFLLASAGYTGDYDRLIEQMLCQIAQTCGWFPEGGSLDVQKWERVGVALRKSPETSVKILHVWRKCRDVIAKLSRPVSQSRAVSKTPKLLPPPQLPGLLNSEKKSADC